MTAENGGAWRSSVRVSLVCSALGLAACGGSTTADDAASGTGDGGLDGASFDGGRDAPTVGDSGQAWAWDLGGVQRDYCEPLAALLCSARATTCPCATAACAEGESVFLEQCIGSYSRATPNGLGTDAVFDGRRLRETLERRRAYVSSCTPDPTPVAARTLGIVVDAEVGSPCPSGSREGLGCAMGDGLCVAGTCSALPDGSAGPCTGACPIGSACSGGFCSPPAGDGAGCRDDLGCMAPLRCIEGLCHALGGDGASCTTSNDCAPGHQCTSGACAPTSTCTSGHSCGRDASCAGGRSGMCAGLARLGEPCFESGGGDFECEPALACSRTSGTCVARAAVGESCGDLYALNGCVEGAVCSASGSCAAPIAIGGVCDGEVACVEGAWCSAGLCVVLGGAGAPCASIGCAPGFVCDDISSTCMAVASTGGRCARSDGCDAGSYCDLTSSTCVARRAEGAPCSSSVDECASDLFCQALPAGVGICAAPSVAGGECSVGTFGACGDTALRCVGGPGPCSCTL